MKHLKYFLRLLVILVIFVPQALAQNKTVKLPSEWTKDFSIQIELYHSASEVEQVISLNNEFGFYSSIFPKKQKLYFALSKSEKQAILDSLNKNKFQNWKFEKSSNMESYTEYVVTVFFGKDTITYNGVPKIQFQQAFKNLKTKILQITDSKYKNRTYLHFAESLSKNFIKISHNGINFTPEISGSSSVDLFRFNKKTPEILLSFDKGLWYFHIEIPSLNIDQDTQAYICEDCNEVAFGYQNGKLLVSTGKFTE